MAFFLILYTFVPMAINVQIARKTHGQIFLTVVGSLVAPLLVLIVSLLVLRDYKKKGKSGFRLW